jgi:signal transduction histidine kinase
MNLYPKYIVTVTSIMLLVVGLFSLVLVEINTRQIYAADEKRVELITEIIKNGLKAIMLEGRGGKEFQKFLDNVIAKDIGAVRIFSENGIVFNSTIPGEIGTRIDEKYMHLYRSHEDASVSAYESDGNRIYSSIFVIKNDWPCQKCHGEWQKISGILGVEVSTDNVGKSLSHVKKMVAGSYCVTTLLFLVAIALSGRYLIKRPLGVLTQSLGNIENGDLASRIPVNSKDEIGEIATGINSIVAELRKCRDEILQFSSDKDRHREKMASLGEVAATVAHEIKNPLAGISGALQVIAEDIPEDSPRKEICREILDEIDRLDNAVKDMLLYAKTPEPHFILTDINGIIERVAGGTGVRLGRPDVEIEVVLGAVPEVLADPEQMEMVFLNMLRNSLYLMPDGGVITVLSHYREDTGEIEIAFSDTGGGIPDETIKDVFKPFFSTKQLGTGLKMAINRNIVENHRGRIEVMSRPGAGSTFSIIIPDKG